MIQLFTGLGIGSDFETDKGLTKMAFKNPNQLQKLEEGIVNSGTTDKKGREKGFMWSVTRMEVIPLDEERSIRTLPFDADTYYLPMVMATRDNERFGACQNYQKPFRTSEEARKFGIELAEKEPRNSTPNLPPPVLGKTKTAQRIKRWTQ